MSSFKFILIAAVLGCCFFDNTSVVAQDSNIAELKKKWDAINSQFAEKEAALKGDGDLDAAKEAYRDLIDEANNVIEKLETASLAELDKKPNDSTAIRTLLGIMLNEAEKGKDAKVLDLGDRLIQRGINQEYFKIAAKSERISTPSREIFDELIIRQEEFIKNDLPRVRIETNKGDIVIELFENEAPNTIGNFVSLVEANYYDDMLFHRVMENFMAQGGGFKLDEKGQEYQTKGPGYTIKCECHTEDKRLHFTNSLSMAHLGPKDTGAAQFFITFERTTFLDGKHTCFGRVISGQEVLESMTRNYVSDGSPGGRRMSGVKSDKIITMELLRKRRHDYLPDRTDGVKEAYTAPGAEKSDKTSAKGTTDKTSTQQNSDEAKSKTAKETEKEPATEKKPDDIQLNEAESAKETDDSKNEKADENNDSSKNESSESKSEKKESKDK